jgi:catechol 2,3-dioxygenase-like lactoylglutathione lyase family enzyme
MARIAHLAIACEDNVAVAEFYKKVFGLVEVERRPDKRDPSQFHISLSDGNIRLALVPKIVGYQEGINHFGFQVDEVDEAAKLALSLGATPGNKLPRGDNPETVIIDPTGTRVDMTAKGWVQATPEQLAEAARALQ